MKQQNDSGFTLIELMIVVAIIGILAAIAIPQFSQYRIKAFNSAAQSDLRNAKLTEEALFADYQEYGVTIATATVGTLGVAAGAQLVSVGTTNNIANTTTWQGVGLSSNVSFIAHTDATGTSAILQAHHKQGDRSYGADTDATSIYYVQNSAYIGATVDGTGGTAATYPTATAQVSDFVVTPTSNGAPVVNWVAL